MFRDKNFRFSLKQDFFLKRYYRFHTIPTHSMIDDIIISYLNLAYIELDFYLQGDQNFTTFIYVMDLASFAYAIRHP